ncbi:MAG: dienelactone hydrolase family protein [Bacteroidia bacterium]|nr:dienelactone hydrolase family protein [Bacteroidia bacterium]
MTTKHFLFIAAVLAAFAAHAQQGKLVTYQIDNEAYEGYYTQPSGEKADKAPLVLVLHDWDGLTDYEIKRADMLAQEGYQVFAADLFGKGIRPTENKDKAQHTGELYKDREKLRRLMTGAIDAAKKQGAATDNVAAMGYCFGGAAALELARSGAALQGFASFHGGLGTPPGQSYAQTKGKVIIFHGTADTAITMNDFANLANELEAAQIPHEMITYGGAPHSFTVFSSPAYREKEDKQSWKRFLKFLQEAFSS